MRRLQSSHVYSTGQWYNKTRMGQNSFGIEASGSAAPKKRGFMRLVPD